MRILIFWYNCLSGLCPTIEKGAILQNISKHKISLVGHRIRQWRKAIPIKGYELAKILKISKGSLSDIENNKSLPSADTIAKFHTNTNINILWLLTGEGPITKEGIALTATQDLDIKNVETDLEMMVAKLMRIYNTGDSEKKALLKGFLEGVDSGPV